jgi:hypothetical protein
MELKKTTRRNRQDRMHAVYVITNILTGEQYVGLTVVAQQVRKALHVRMQKHIRRALTENKNWALCRSIREFGAEAFDYGILETVRGRKPAHVIERGYINSCNPALNTH